MHSDIVVALDEGSTIVLIMFDLSAAYDVIYRLKFSFGIYKGLKLSNVVPCRRKTVCIGAR